MGFNSTAFAVFLPLVFGLYWAISPGSLRRQNIFLLVVSYVFYGWWDARFLGLILVSSAADFWVGRAVHRASIAARRKAWLAVSIGVNLGILGLFKYYDFFVESLVDSFALFGVRLEAATLGIVLPVGISFYTFQTLSYTIDIYRRRAKPTNDAVAFFAFVAFFPQLVAGPIERARRLLPQFERRRRFDEQRAVAGLQLMLWGFFKKLAVADRVAPFVDTAFAPEASPSSAVVILGALAFTVQLYADFSGYSDIAVGTARLFGFELMTNFKAPLLAGSLQDLWQRWHISFSTWLRDYVYATLGGKRHGTARWIFNIILTFVISGLWHGARLNFPASGLALGVALSIERLAAQHAKRFRLRGAIAVVATFATFAFCLIFFRAHGLAHAMRLISALFVNIGTFTLDQVVEAAFIDRLDVVYVSLSVGLLFFVDRFTRRGDINSLFDSMPRAPRWALYYALLAWIALLGEFNAAPSFIYFQF